MPNKFEAQIEGRLGKDADIRTSKAGKEYARLSIATTRGKDENKKTFWNAVTIFGYAVDQCRNMKKGDLVRVEISEPGTVNTWTKNNGEVVNEVQYISFKAMRIDWIKGPGQAAQGDSRGSQASQAPSQGSQAPRQPNGEKPLPF